MRRSLASLAAIAVTVILSALVLAARAAPAAPAASASPAAPTLPVGQAVVRARQYLQQFRNPDLVPAEIMEFTNVFYVVVQERSTRKGAFALLVDRINGNASPEMGPPMMWNTKYGRWIGGVGSMGPGMMGPGYGPGGMGRGMMGLGYGPGYGPGAQPVPGVPAPGAQAGVLDEAKARAALQVWVNQAFPGAGVGQAVEFPGFFTYRLIRDARTFALASVHAYGGQVWYAWHYGAFVREQVIR